MWSTGSEGSVAIGTDVADDNAEFSTGTAENLFSVQKGNNHATVAEM